MKTVTLEVTPAIWRDQWSWAEDSGAEFTEAPKGRKVLVTMPISTAWDFLDQIAYYAEVQGGAGMHLGPAMAHAYYCAHRSLLEQSATWPAVASDEVPHCCRADCDNPADEGRGDLCAECRIETTCELCGSTTDVRMRLATYQNNAWLERVCDVCVAHIRADCEFERPWYQDATTCDDCLVNADYDAHGCRQENGDMLTVRDDAELREVFGFPTRTTQPGESSVPRLWGKLCAIAEDAGLPTTEDDRERAAKSRMSDDDRELYQRMDRGYAKQQYFARAVSLF